MSENERAAKSENRKGQKGNLVHRPNKSTNSHENAPNERQLAIKYKKHGEIV